MKVAAGVVIILLMSLLLYPNFIRPGQPLFDSCHCEDREISFLLTCISRLISDILGLLQRLCAYLGLEVFKP